MSTEIETQQETPLQEVVDWEAPTPPIDLVFDDRKSLETNRYRIAMNVLINSAQF